MIVGAQKAGTTSLLRYLAQHRLVCTHMSTELLYFSDDNEFERGWSEAAPWYFPDFLEGQKPVAKCAALYRDERFVSRLYDHNPGCQIVMVFRDPVERAFSSYLMARSRGTVRMPFDHLLEVLDDPADYWHRQFIGLGDYPAALRRLYRYYPREQVLLYLFEDFRSSPASVCGDLFGRLELSPIELDTGLVHNAARVRRSMLYGRAIRWLVQPENPVKNLARSMLPSPLFHRLGAAAISSNYRSASEERPSEETRWVLGKFFLDRNLELQEVLERDLSHWTGMS